MVQGAGHDRKLRKVSGTFFCRKKVPDTLVAALVADLGQRGKLPVFGEVPATQEQGVAPVPENPCGLVQAALVDPFPQVSPSGSTAVAGIVLLVVPPEFESAERLATVISYAQYAVGIQELLDMPFVCHGDPFHCWILHDSGLSLAFT
jgi:hypothetical protein